MNIYIAEDSLKVRKVLESIINDSGLGHIIGNSENGQMALEEIDLFKPNIVLVNLHMPGKDGVSLVKESKLKNPNTQYIIISEETSKELISKAYESGIEYYITKPIDSTEIQIVLKKVIEKINMIEKLSQIEKLIFQ